MDQVAKINVNNYLEEAVNKHTPVINYDLSEKIQHLLPHIHAWANGYEYELKLSGSLAKGTGIIGTTDIDIFISLHPSVYECNTLEFVYTTLRNRLNGSGYAAIEQNVSLGIEHAGLKIDLVPGVKHHVLGLDHSIWKRKAKTWTKTNIDEHIKYVSESGRIFDIKIVKIWRKIRGLDFPSFYLEMSVIEALKGKSLSGDPSGNFIEVMNYLATDFMDALIQDPSNQSNIVSEELTRAEKEKIKNAAEITLSGQWHQAIW